MLNHYYQKEESFKLRQKEFSVVFAKGIDVTTYVEHGIADIGIVGEDILLEFQPDVFDLLPLPFGKCRFAVAGEPGDHAPFRKQRIATKYPNITTKYFREQGKSVDIVKLEGSVELAPLIGLADNVVDIVETGSTLDENGLIIKEEMFTISARCIANRNSLKLKKAILSPIIDSFRIGEAVI